MNMQKAIIRPVMFPSFILHPLFFWVQNTTKVQRAKAFTIPLVLALS